MKIQEISNKELEEKMIKLMNISDSIKNNIEIQQKKLNDLDKNVQEYAKLYL